MWCGAGPYLPRLGTHVPVILHIRLRRIRGFQGGLSVAVTDDEGSRKIAGRNPLNVPVPDGFAVAICYHRGIVTPMNISGYLRVSSSVWCGSVWRWRRVTRRTRQTRTTVSRYRHT